MSIGRQKRLFFAEDYRVSSLDRIKPASLLEQEASHEIGEPDLPPTIAEALGATAVAQELGTQGHNSIQDKH